MNSRALSIISLRLLGIYCIVESLLATQTVYYVIAMPEGFASPMAALMIGALLPSILLLGSGLVMIMSAPRIANRINPDLGATPSHGEWTLQGLQSVLISVLGLYVFTEAIPPMFKWASQLFTPLTHGPQGVTFNANAIRDNWVSLFLTTMQMIVATGLFFGARKITSLWHRLGESSSSTHVDRRT